MGGCNSIRAPRSRPTAHSWKQEGGGEDVHTHDVLRDHHLGRAFAPSSAVGQPLRVDEVAAPLVDNVDIPSEAYLCLIEGLPQKTYLLCFRVHFRVPRTAALQAAYFHAVACGGDSSVSHCYDRVHEHW